VADFEDDPDTVTALVAPASISQFEHAAQRARDERERTQRRQAFAAELGEHGITVLGADADAPPLHRLTDAEGTNLTDTDHAQCPGHAVTITRRYGQIDPTTGQPVVDELGDKELDDEDFFDEDAEQEGEEPTTVWREYPSAVFVCTDPERPHPHHPVLRLRQRKHQAQARGHERGRRRSRPRAAARRHESNKAWHAAEPVRRVWRLWGLLARKALAALIDRASEPRAQVLGLSVVLAGYEDATHTGSWRHVDPATRRYLTYLADCGYTLADVERRACG